jgi:hypothetical protein
MNVGVMKDYKLRDLHASHTLGWSWYCFVRVQTENKKNQSFQLLARLFYHLGKLERALQEEGTR